MHLVAITFGPQYVFSRKQSVNMVIFCNELRLLPLNSPENQQNRTVDGLLVATCIAPPPCLKKSKFAAHQALVFFGNIWTQSLSRSMVYVIPDPGEGRGHHISINMKFKGLWLAEGVGYVIQSGVGCFFFFFWNLKYSEKDTQDFSLSHRHPSSNGMEASRKSYLYHHKVSIWGREEDKVSIWGREEKTAHSTLILT